MLRVAIEGTTRSHSNLYLREWRNWLDARDLKSLDFGHVSSTLTSRIMNLLNLPRSHLKSTYMSPPVLGNHLDYIIIDDLRKQVNRIYDLGFSVSREMIEDNDVYKIDKAFLDANTMLKKYQDGFSAITSFWNYFIPSNPGDSRLPKSTQMDFSTYSRKELINIIEDLEMILRDAEADLSCMERNRNLEASNSSFWKAKYENRNEDYNKLQDKLIDKLSEIRD